MCSTTHFNVIRHCVVSLKYIGRPSLECNCDETFLENYPLVHKAFWRRMQLLSAKQAGSKRKTWKHWSFSQNQPPHCAAEQRDRKKCPPVPTASEPMLQTRTHMVSFWGGSYCHKLWFLLIIHFWLEKIGINVLLKDSQTHLRHRYKSGSMTVNRVLTLYYHSDITILRHDATM